MFATTVTGMSHDYGVIVKQTESKLMGAAPPTQGLR